MPNTTTIKLRPQTRDLLQAFKGKYSYDEIVAMLLKSVPEGDEEGRYTPQFRLELLEARLNPGPYITHEQMKRRLGLA